MIEEQMKQIERFIEVHRTDHAKSIEHIKEAERYYRNQNDILAAGAKAKNNEASPNRNADNRIPSNFHGLLVNQKASYMFTVPPSFDVGNKTANETIVDALGDEYVKVCKDLCINASNCGVAWLHYWKNEDNIFEYAAVRTEQIIPAWTATLKKKLDAVLRMYTECDVYDSTKETEYYEYWTDTECITLARDKGMGDYALCEERSFSHDYGEVPFIMFSNNNVKMSDLQNIKRLIDIYDKVLSGYINDLDDIQEVIFILSGYDGTDLEPFLRNLKEFKTVKLDGDDNAGLSTLTIDIPVEARKVILDLVRKAIFEQGQGIDPDPQNFGNSSGVALGYLYSLLELKAGLMETEFNLSFSRLIRAICKVGNIKAGKITQTWTRTRINNDAELVEMVAKSIGVTSKRTALKNHPFVKNVEDELKLIAAEEVEESKKYDFTAGMFGQNKAGELNGEGKKAE